MLAVAAIKQPIDAEFDTLLRLEKRVLMLCSRVKAKTESLYPNQATSAIEIVRRYKHTLKCVDFRSTAQPLEKEGCGVTAPPPQTALRHTAVPPHHVCTAKEPPFASPDPIRPIPLD